MNAMQAARLACEHSNWTLTRPQVNKILYLAHMIHAGRTDAMLIDEAFEAQDVGPVMPALDRIIAAFGAGQIQNVFHGVLPAQDAAEAQSVREAVDELGALALHELVTLVHDPRGAWRRFYRPGASIPIPQSAIVDEYNARFGVPPQ